MSEFWQYTLLAVSSLFFIIDPLASIPAFVAMTPHDTPKARARMAGLACLVAAGVLIGFAFLGEHIFHFLGITIPAFKMAGSIVLLLVALDMLRAKRSAVVETSEETEAGAEKDDIAITPLAVPMLAGPGAITTAILLHNEAKSLDQQLALVLSIVVVLAASYLVFRLSARGATWLNPIALKIITRVMGLLLAALSCQFMFDALKEFKAAF
jgi:multiple antibiotic resistance protein